METIEYTITEADGEQRLDRLIAALCDTSRTVAQQWVNGGLVLVNSRPAAKSCKPLPGDRLQISIPPPAPVQLLAQDIPLSIFYEDDHLLVVDKPKGMVVHPAPGNSEGTLVNALMHHCGSSLSGIGGEIRPGIVHRIDKDTSGLLVVAKHDKAHQGLAAQFAAHSMERVYNAVIYGRLPQPEGTVDAPIGRDLRDRKRMAVVPGGKRAVTHYRVLAEYPGFSHLELRLETGRTHQIRVHMAKLGHPLAGDTVYGPKKAIRQLAGQCLHAGVLGFTHPVTGRQLRFETPLPPYFLAFLAKISMGNA